MLIRRPFSLSWLLLLTACAAPGKGALAQEAAGLRRASVLDVVSVTQASVTSARRCRPALLTGAEWQAQAVAQGGSGGWPAAVAGAAIGGALGSAMGHRLHASPLPGTLAGAAVGAWAGRALWLHFLHPAPPLPETPDGMSAVFLPGQRCSQIPLRTYAPPRYRVVYAVDGREYSVILDEDPGEALLLAADGQVVGALPRLPEADLAELHISDTRVVSAVSASE